MSADSASSIGAASLVTADGGSTRRSAGSVWRAARIGFATLVALAVVSVAILSAREGVGLALQTTRWWGIAGALALGALSVLAEGGVLAILSGKVRPMSVLRMARAYVAGNFLGLVTPWALGGAPSWFWALSREGAGLSEAAALVTARSVVAAGFFTAMAIVAVVALPTISGASGTVVLSAVVPVGLIVFVAYGLNHPARAAEVICAALRWLRQRAGIERLDAVIERAPEAVMGFFGVLAGLISRRPLALAGAMLAMAAARFCQLAALPLLLAAQGYRMTAGPTMIGLVLLWVGASISPTPSGEGVAQALVASIFGPLATPQAAAAAALVWRASVYYPIFLVGGLLFARLVRGQARTETVTLPKEGTERSE